jgi:hypothetical protein
MTKKNLKIGAFAVAILAATTLSHAQYIRPAYAFPEKELPNAVQVADSAVYVSPSISGVTGHDDNLILSHTGQISSYLVGMAPGLKVESRAPGMVFQGNYNASIAHYTSSGADDYADQNYLNQFDVAFDRRTFLRVGYDFIRGHDARGSTDRAISPNVDRYKNSVPNAMFAFGAPGAQGRVELYVSDAHKDYLNNRSTTAVSDRTTTEGGGAFYWRVGPKTYVLVEARDTKIDYDIPNPNSGNEHRYFLGVSWEATAATSGTLKFGQLRRSFDSPQPTTDSSAWEGWVTWQPLTYSRVDFYTARQSNESTGLGNFILSSIGTLNWAHDWNSYVSTGVNLRYQRDEYQGFDRTDTTKGVGLKIGYKFRRWLTLGAEYNYTKRDSNIDIYEYDRNQYLLTATAAM